MAEKSLHPHTLVLALTYNEETQENRDAARMFQYADVRAFIKRLAAAVRYADPTAKVRFLCAGEQGDRNGRCHWHLVIYSGVDITTLGKVQGFPKRRPEERKRVKPVKGLLTERFDMLTVGKDERRLDWTLWGHGYVTFQEADEGGMHYVLSYCLKDQFTVEKSHETMRESKTENFATGLFRMSKRPAIGEAWLYAYLEGLEASGGVLPSVQLTVPGMSGYWHPNGLFREKLLWGLVALNQRALWSTGANAPQWAALLASCAENEKDLEVLNNVTEAQTVRQDVEQFERHLAQRQHKHAFDAGQRDFHRVCANLLPCENCLGQLSEQILKTLGVERIFDRENGETIGVYRYRALEGFAAVEERQETPTGALFRANAYCIKRGSEFARPLPPGGYAGSGYIGPGKVEDL
ncbi:rolling circle replication-associated protein [Rhodobacter ferrooxidans]|uniref:Replication-associated protein ORF2/G2P domain-containing protein n=1 Tax=Rhodobacter ferrooxidans TaxID=371731 RepID=C8RZ60_9RHOB|nr:hypothetical protein [Rhodobacter sp. SW2]EEW26017.1 hypothetical protein Rsw2DRAFT_1088 [Rhodobacter sp. SW2]